MKLSDLKHIKRWSVPRHYFGERWYDFYVAPVTCHRDSDALERTNWAAQCREIPESSTVVVVRENHFLVGWIEWLAIHYEDSTALATAERLAEQLAEYPCLDDSLLALIVESEEDQS
jgi:hypothetical protein